MQCLKTRNYHSSDANKDLRKKAAEDFALIPEMWRVVAASVLYGVCSLAWDYADTILDECATRRIESTKKDCRRVRELRREYDQFRATFFTRDDLENEVNLGLGVEEACSPHLSALNFTASKIARENGKSEQKAFISAVAQCMTVTSAIMGYGLVTDGKICDIFKIQIPTDYMLVPNQVIILHKMLAHFLGKDLAEALRPHITSATRNMVEAMMGAELMGCEQLRTMRFRKWTKAEERFALLADGKFTDEQASLCIGRTATAFRNKIKQLSAKRAEKIGLDSE